MWYLTVEDPMLLHVIAHGYEVFPQLVVMDIGGDLETVIKVRL